MTCLLGFKSNGFLFRHIILRLWMGLCLFQSNEGAEMVIFHLFICSCLLNSNNLFSSFGHVEHHWIKIMFILVSPTLNLRSETSKFPHIRSLIIGYVLVCLMIYWRKSVDCVMVEIFSYWVFWFWVSNGLVKL